MNNEQPDLNSNLSSEIIEKVLLSAIENKSIELNFNAGVLTTDAGLLLLRETERQIGIIDDVARLLDDARDQRYVKHSTKDLLIQRTAQIAAGYEDANDCQALRYDPIVKMFANRQPESDPPLASQPTMSRFENSIRQTQLLRLAYLLLNKFIASYPEAPALIVIDTDDTEDKVYGAQQESLFNSYYNDYCYLPLHIYEGISGKLITTLLKPGKRATGKLMLGIVKRLVRRIRQTWPKTHILFRGDSHFSYDEVMSWIETQENVSYVLGLPANPVLKAQAQPLVARATTIFQARQAEAREKGWPISDLRIQCYHTMYYRAQKWGQYRRVVAKIEITSTRSDLRCIITNHRQAQAKSLYEKVYSGRGQMELYIKEHKVYLKSDRTSCTRFEANQFRLFLHSIAYILIHALRTNILQHTVWANASIQTLRLRLFKIGARVRELKTCIRVELPTAFPLQSVIRRSFQIFAALAPPA